jgi:hypothetical protein
VVSRVLPPMRIEQDETIRAFAARVRATVVEARHVLLRELLATPRMARSRRHFFTGLGPAARRAAATEERAGAWRAVLAAGADDGDWLLIGCGWSTVAVALRQLLPAARFGLWEPDPRRLAVARHAWFDPVLDHLVADADALPPGSRPAGVLCWHPDLPGARALLQAAVAARPRLVLIAGGHETPAGYAPVACPARGWSAFIVAG